VPAVLALLSEADGLGEGFVMPRLPGESLAPKYLRDDSFALARANMTQQCADILAAIHRVRLDLVGEIDLPDQSPKSQVLALEALFRALEGHSPVFELAFSWLKRNLPRPGRRSLVHGDFRSGNFLVEPATGLTAVLDWELAHIGDPTEDLGWLCVNSWRFGHWNKPVGGFGTREPFYAAYEAASGHLLDRDALLFWELYGTLRWGLSCLQLVHQHLSGAVVSVERAAIGRRISETEIDLLHLLRHGTL
jgi:aminoglycoside phosphotransferase (APT) family kinase protein